MLSHGYVDTMLAVYTPQVEESGLLKQHVMKATEVNESDDKPRRVVKALKFEWNGGFASCSVGEQKWYSKRCEESKK